MIYPKKLQKGATIGLVCPSSPVSVQRREQCISALENLGYKVKAAANLTENHGGYMAGSGKIRGQWINKMFSDPEVDAVFCVRGGDGGSRCIEYIDLDVVRKNPKIFLGYSDVTSLHLYFNQNAGLVTFHGPMVSSNLVDGCDEETARALFDALSGEGDYVFRNPPASPVRVMKEGRATGPLTGGNLSLLSATMGTPYEMDARGKIIFIEEVAEPVTKIEKWCYQLRNAGKFRDCRGVLLGQLTDISNELMPEYTALDCIGEILADYDIPVMYDLQSGHGRPMITLPFGALCTMDTASGYIGFVR